MPVVRIKNKYQVTLPKAARQALGMEIGDFLEAHVEKGKVTLTPRTLLDKQLAQALEQVRKGKAYGPFDSVDEMIIALKKNYRKSSKK
jgi:AbrB family looped-hinge helix DNA binding protein